METSNMRESQAYYLDGTFLYSQYEKLLEAFQVLYPGEKPVGLCITPAKVIFDNMTRFYSNGIKVMLVRFQPAAINTQPDELVIFDVENTDTLQDITDALVQLRPAGGGTEAAPPVIDVNGLINFAKIATNPLVAISFWNDYFYFNATSEFEYAFIDLDTFEYLAKPDNMEFYRKQTVSGVDHYYDVNNSEVTAPVRGIHFSRAVITLEVGPRQYKDFRTLKLRPGPEPALVEFDSRPSTAYYLTPTCPPYWRNTGGGGTTTGLMMAATPVEARQSRQVVFTGPDDCTCNKVNMVLLHSALKDAKIIGENQNMPYRVNTRWFFAALVASLLIIGFTLVTKEYKLFGEGKTTALARVLDVLNYLAYAYVVYVFAQLFRKLEQKQ